MNLRRRLQSFHFGETQQSQIHDTESFVQGLDAFFMAAPAGMALFDSHLRLLKANSTMAEMIGRPLEQIVGQTPGAVAPLLSPVLEPILVHVSSTGRPALNFPLSDQTPNVPGVIRRWVASVFPISRGSDSKWTIGAIALEVTEPVQFKGVRQGEAPFAAAEQLAGLGSWEYDVPSGRMAWSDQCYRLLGFDPRKTLATKELLFETVHFEDRERFLAEFNQAIAEAKPIDTERRFALPGGRIRINHTRATPVRDRSGQVIRLVGMSQDITERKEAEQKLRKSEALLAQAEQLANVGSWELDLKTGVLTWSAQIYRMLNVNPQGAPETADRFWQIVHPDDRERVQREEARAIAEHQPLASEVRCVLPDGRIRILDQLAVPVYDETGHAVRIGGMVQDITDRKESEERLRKSEALLTEAEQIANFGSWELDIKTRKSVISDQLCALFGVAPGAEWSEESYWNTMHPSDRERVYQISSRAIAECRPFEFTAQYYMPDGTLRTYFTRAAPIPGTDGKAERVRGIVQDITEQMRAEEDLRRLSQQLLRTRDAERRQMARELHETAGQSLAALKMMLGRLRDALPEDDEMARGLVERSVEVAEDAVREVRLVSYLMHPPMLDEGGLGLALQWYVRGFSERSGIQAQVEVAENFGRYPQEIETTIFRVVQEALTNVHRYSGSRTVAIRLAREDGQIRAEVRDQGCGLALPAPATGWDAPLGVGIAGMRERVKQLHGAFEIESAPGRGTTVRAILPIPHEDASSTAAGEAPQELRIDREGQKSKEKRAGR
jgi:PAS domain S-box-containing protein